MLRDAHPPARGAMGIVKVVWRIQCVNLSAPTIDRTTGWTEHFIASLPRAVAVRWRRRSNPDPVRLQHDPPRASLLPAPIRAIPSAGHPSGTDERLDLQLAREASRPGSRSDREHDASRYCPWRAPTLAVPALNEASHTRNQAIVCVRGGSGAPPRRCSITTRSRQSQGAASAFRHHTRCTRILAQAGLSPSRATALQLESFNVDQFAPFSSANCSSRNVADADEDGAVRKTYP